MPLLRVVLYSLIPVAAAALGAVLAVLRRPGTRLQSYIQHFAGGIVFAVVAVELLPDVVEARTLSAVVIGFTAGVLLMLGLRSIARRAEGGQPGSGTVSMGLSASARLEGRMTDGTVAHWEPASAIAPTASTAIAAPAAAGGPTPGVASNPPTPPTAAQRVSTALLVSIGVDVVLDGLLLGIGFAVGAKEGVLLTVALTAELLSLALALALRLLEGGASRVRTTITAIGILALMVPGTLAGVIVLSGVGDHVIAGVLSFGAAALLYLVTEELLTAAHEIPETPASTTMFFAGFLAFFVLELANA